jgi:Uma2 family endonuclease
MSTAAPPRFRPPRSFDNAAEWLRALGDVPLERIIFDPWPGTATEADLLTFVERDKRLCELIDGTLVEKPVGWYEAIIATNLSIALGVHVQRTNAGVVAGADSTLRMPSTGRVRLPDVAFVSTARLPKTRERIPTLAPDLAVEVLSQSNTPAEIAQKLREYFDSGTRLAWVIDPEARTAAIYHRAGEPTRVLNETDQLDGEQVLPGFTFPVADLFRGVPAA